MDHKQSLQKATGLALFLSAVSLVKLKLASNPDHTSNELSLKETGHQAKEHSAVPALSSTIPVTSLSSSSSVSCGDCTACDDHAPPVDPMRNSVKQYDRHILLCDDRTDWPKNIENDLEEYPYNLVRMIENAATPSLFTADDASEFIVKVNACNYKAPETDIYINSPKKTSTPRRCVIVYPDNLMFSVSDDQLDLFAKFVCSRAPLTSLTHFAYELKEFNSTVPSWEYLILVCVHGSRDKRCGRAGPQVIDEINGQLKARRANIPEGIFAVHGTSHIGGHAFAGTAIVYPQGDWYGRLSKSSAGELVDNIVQGTVFEKGWRGNGLKLQDGSITKVADKSW